MSTESFIPTGYEPPKTGGGFTTLENGYNKFRILSSPLMMWIEWRDGVCIKHKFTPESKPSKGSGQKDSVKHGWGLIVWNYKTEKIEVFELDKQDIITGLTKHANDPDWGHPKGYDVVIEKKGSGMETTYSLICKPHSEVSEDIIQAYTDNPIDLSQLLVDGGSPFLNSEKSTSSSPAPSNKVVTPENWAAGDPPPKGYTVNENGELKKLTPF